MKFGISPALCTLISLKMAELRCFEYVSTKSSFRENCRDQIKKITEEIIAKLFQFKGDEQYQEKNIPIKG